MTSRTSFSMMLNFPKFGDCLSPGFLLGLSIFVHGAHGQYAGRIDGNSGVFNFSPFRHQQSACYLQSVIAYPVSVHLWRLNSLVNTSYEDMLHKNCSGSLHGSLSFRFLLSLLAEESIVPRIFARISRRRTNVKNVHGNRRHGCFNRFPVQRHGFDPEIIPERNKKHYLADIPLITQFASQAYHLAGVFCYNG